MKRLWIVLLLLAGLVAWGVGPGVSPAYAQDCNEAKTIFADSFVLEEGETLDCDLVVVGGNVVIEEGATIPGKVVVLGGNVEIAGEVQEDVTVMGGSVHLSDSAHILGKVASIGGSLSRDEGAEVEGGESQGFSGLPSSPDAPFYNMRSSMWTVFSPFIRIFNTVVAAVALSLVALLAALFWPEQTTRISAAIINAPVVTGGLGLLTFVALPFVMLLLTITVCLIPFTFLGGLLFVIGMLLGWLALGHLVGVRLASALNASNLSPAMASAMGTFLLTLTMQALALVPCVGWIPSALLGCIGLGATLITRFGTQPYFTGGAVPPQPTPPTDMGGMPTTV